MTTLTNSASDLTISVAATERDLEEVYRLRYHVYVELMAREQKYANHRLKIIEEPMDVDGVSYVVRHAGRAVGTIRRNKLSDRNIEYYKQFYKTHLFEDLRESSIQLTTKLMVLPEFSGTAVPIRLLQRYAADSYDAGIRIDIIDCNSHLIRFFERLGYFSYLGWADHEEYGRVRPMFLITDAVEHMRRTQSALYHIAAAKLRDGEYGGYSWMRTLAQKPMFQEAVSAWQALQDA